MFGTNKFRDAFAFVENGFANSVRSTGTSSGSAIQLGGPSPLRRMVHILEAASGTASTAVVSFYLSTATASGGTFVSLSQGSQIASVTGSGKWYLVLDTRNEWFGDLATNALWIKPVIVVTTTALPVSLMTLGYLAGSLPASNFDSASIVMAEADLF